MRRMVALGILAFAMQPGIAAADEGRCLHYRDLDGISKVDTQTLVAKAKGGGRYKILVDAKCQYQDWPENYFVTRNMSPHECVSPGDALALHLGGSCFIQSVTPIQSN